MIRYTPATRTVKLFFSNDDRSDAILMCYFPHNAKTLGEALLGQGSRPFTASNWSPQNSKPYTTIKMEAEATKLANIIRGSFLPEEQATVDVVSAPFDGGWELTITARSLTVPAMYVDSDTAPSRYIPWSGSESANSDYYRMAQFWLAGGVNRPTRDLVPRTVLMSFTYRLTNPSWSLLHVGDNGPITLYRCNDDTPYYYNVSNVLMSGDFYDSVLSEPTIDRATAFRASFQPNFGGKLYVDQQAVTGKWPIDIWCGKQPGQFPSDTEAKVYWESAFGAALATRPANESRSLYVKTTVVDKNPVGDNVGMEYVVTVDVLHDVHGLWDMFAEQSPRDFRAKLSSVKVGKKGSVLTWKAAVASEMLQNIRPTNITTYPLDGVAHRASYVNQPSLSTIMAGPDIDIQPTTVPPGDTTPGPVQPVEGKLMPWLSIIMAILGFLTSLKKNPGDKGKAIAIGALAGLGTYYVSHETEWGADTFGKLDGNPPVATTLPPGDTWTNLPDGTRVPATTLNSPSAIAGATTGLWNAVGSIGPGTVAAGLGAVGIATGALDWKKFLPWIVIGVVGYSIIK